MTYQDVFSTIILLIVAVAGAPIIQLFKVGLSAILKRPIEDRWALVLSGVVAAGIAILEMVLAGALDFSLINIQTFPEVFFAVFTVAQFYFGMFKRSETVFGKKFLLRE